MLQAQNEGGCRLIDGILDYARHTSNSTCVSSPPWVIRKCECLLCFSALRSTMGFLLLWEVQQRAGYSFRRMMVRFQLQQQMTDFKVAIWRRVLQGVELPGERNTTELKYPEHRAAEQHNTLQHSWDDLLAAFRQRIRVAVQKQIADFKVAVAGRVMQRSPLPEENTNKKHSKA